MNTHTWTWDGALTGVIPPVISVLNDDGAIDATEQEAICAHIMHEGGTGLFMLGGCGEGAWLTPTQRSAVVRHAVRAADAKAPVIVGVMLPATGPAVEAAKRAADDGADGIVAGTPYYNQVGADAQVRHLEAILRATSLPILLYNIPSSTHHMMAPATVEALAADPRILGIKDSSGNLEHVQELIAIKARTAHFRVLQGAEFAMGASALMGADGAVPGMGNFAPGLFLEIFSAGRAGDIDRVRTLQQQITSLTRLHGLGGHWLPSLKAACRLLGLGNGRPAAPLIPSSHEQVEAIRACISPYLPVHLAAKLS